MVTALIPRAPRAASADLAGAGSLCLELRRWRRDGPGRPLRYPPPCNAVRLSVDRCGAGAGRTCGHDRDLPSPPLSPRSPETDARSQRVRTAASCAVRAPFGAPRSRAAYLSEISTDVCRIREIPGLVPKPPQCRATSGGNDRGTEPPRVRRRLFGLNHAAIRKRVLACPDATLEELKAWLLGVHHIEVSTTLVWETLKHLDLTLKKDHPRGRTRPSGCS